MSTGKVWIYRLLFAFCVFFVCTVTDFSGDDKTSGFKFNAEVHRRPGLGISHFGERCFPRSAKSDKSARGELDVGSACVDNRQSRSLTALVSSASKQSIKNFKSSK